VVADLTEPKRPDMAWRSFDTDAVAGVSQLEACDLRFVTSSVA